MRVLRAVLTVGFAIALVACFLRIYLAPPVDWVEWALLTAGVSALGGIAIGTRWAVGVAFGVTATLSVLLVIVVATLAHHLGAAWFLLVQVLVSTGATAAAVHLRTSLGHASAR